MICYDAYKNMNLVSKQNNLEVSSCCLIPTTPEATITFYNSKQLIKVRQSWDKNEFPEECAVCKIEEDQHRPSRRLGTNKWYEDNNYANTTVELIRLDYWTGDTCNLRCAICGPQNSSSRKQELNFPKELKKVSNNIFWKKLNLSSLRYIHFNGGEPLLNKEHVKFLHAMPNKNKVHLNYNTNGSVLPGAELIELWRKFKLVQLDFSIDDINSRFEYQRYPANWKEVTENLQWFIDNSPVNCMFAVNTTVSILNHANLSNLNNWLTVNFHTNRVTDPIQHRLQQASGVFSINNVEHRNDARKFLDDCDARRGTNWRETFPELIQIL